MDPTQVERVYTLNSSVTDGIYIADKPCGITSAQMVAKLKKQLIPLNFGRKIKIGHLGTLDPLASGVLVIEIGKGTKLMEWALTQSKTYFACIRFGWETSTEDLEGEPTVENDVVSSFELIQMTTESMVGEIYQQPSSVSALKVGGRHAYNITGVVLAPRKVNIYQIRIERYEYPELLLAVRCGRGVYVRALARDIGRQCGAAAHLGSLRRIEYAGWWACEKAV